MGIRKISPRAILILVLSITLVSCIYFEKQAPIKIFNTCSDYCDSLNVSGIAKSLGKELEKKLKNPISVENHPFYKNQIRSIIIYSKSSKNIAREIKKFIPFIKDSLSNSDTVFVLLGIDVFGLKWTNSVLNKPGVKSESLNKNILLVPDQFLKYKQLLNFSKSNDLILLKLDHLPQNDSVSKILYPQAKESVAKSLSEKIKKIFNLNVKFEADSSLKNVVIILNPIIEDYWIRIVKSQFKLYLYKGDKLVKVYPVGLGKNPGDKERVGDMRTPEGDFYIIKIHDSRNWTHDFGDGKGPIRGAYGPWFLRLYTGSDRTRSGKSWTGIGIHGTHDSTSIGKMVSEGCIRMYNSDIEELRKIVKIGTTVIIDP